MLDYTGYGIRTRVLTSKGSKDCLNSMCPLPQASTRYYIQIQRDLLIFGFSKRLFEFEMLPLGFEPKSRARKARRIAKGRVSTTLQELLLSAILPRGFEPRISRSKAECLCPLSYGSAVLCRRFELLSPA